MAKSELVNGIMAGITWNFIAATLLGAVGGFLIGKSLVSPGT